MALKSVYLKVTNPPPDGESSSFSQFVILLYTVCQKVTEINNSKRPLKEIVKNLFDAKLSPLFSILTWRSRAICHLVYLTCVSQYLQ